MNPKKTIVIVGPTATGKSSLATRLAQEHDGEVVSADSRQVYRHMDIGTAKPSPEMRSMAPHHLIDIIEPDEEFSLALFLRQARSAIEDIHSGSRLPLVVGGTGQYVWALVEGWQVPEVTPDPELRQKLEATARREGSVALHRELAREDPSAARRVDPNNPRRIIRAIEVARAGARDSASTSRRVSPPFHTVMLGLTLPRSDLDERINQRVDDMIQAGWVAEVQRLMARGYGLDLPAMSGLGYGELARHVLGEMKLDDAVAEIKRRTRHFARRQGGWFRLTDERIRWFQATPGGLDEASDAAAEMLDKR